MPRFSTSVTRFWHDLPFLWKFQIIFWSIYAIGSAPISIVGLRYAAQWKMSIGGLIIYLLVDNAYFLLNTSLIGTVLNRPFFRRQRIPALILSALLLVSASLAFGMLVTFPHVFRPLIASLSSGPPRVRTPDTPLKLVTARIYNFMLLGGWTTVYLIGRAAWENRNRKRQLELAEARSRHAELLMLRSQINPHFLFNAMTTIVGETGGNEKLNHIVSGLSDYLRYSLANRSRTFVPFGEEIEATTCYLDVERTRLGDILQVEFDIDPSSRPIPVPGVLLQPLVENAIKYGVRTSPRPLRLKISTHCENGATTIEVANSGTWVEETNHPSKRIGGVGLSNVKERLALFYPDSHRVTTTSENGWVTIRIELQQAS